MRRHRMSSSISLMRWATLLWILLCSSASALETKPQATYPLPHEAETPVISSHVLQARAGVKPFTLRIMPLGASITAGYGTTNEQGYRKPLRDQLRWRGWPVNMIGSLRGTSEVNFKNDQHEGHKGHVVNQTIDDSDLSLYRKPNLILINCGTNDVPHDDYGTTGERMQLVLNHLFKEVTGVTVILSTIVPRLDGSENTRRSEVISEQYRKLVKDNAAAGWKIVLADVAAILTPAVGVDYYDDLHPNDRGAAKFAAVWDKAIFEAESKNFLTEPIDTGTPDVSNGADTGGQGTCPVVRGALRGPVKTQSGWGYDDGTYAHRDGYTFDIDLGNTVIDDIESGTGGIWFAQLLNPGNADFGDYLDELVYCTDAGPGQVPGPCLMWENSDGWYDKIDAKPLDIGLACLARGIRFGDVNGDGLDDAICINQEAKMYVAINKGGNPPTFEVLANGGLVRGAGSQQTCDSQAQVRLGDMDGDGRLDYCCIDKMGDIYCWRNGGSGKAPTAEENGYWQELVGGITFKAKGESEGIDGVRFVDVNGDGRTDWVYVHEDGSSDIYVNQRGSYSEDGKGLAPHWAKASSTHAAVDSLDTRDNIYFGRLKPRSYRGDNLPTRADRIVVQNLTATAGKNDPKIGLVFQPNLGAGGTKLKGDGVFYCDMFGSGSDDYLWVLSTGAITLFKNIHSPPQWGPLGEIIDIKRDRKSIHFGDWDGDGKCDILAVERHTGRVEWWRNLYKTGDQVPTFAAPQWAVDSYDHLCTEGWGNGVYDYGLEFADLDGDKRVDYLCMKKDMQVFGSLNKAGGLQWKDQIKFAPDNGTLDRANFKWADVDGDGKTDLIWVDKFNGKGRLWTNGGFIPVGGSSMTWNYQGFRFDGHGRGQNIHFPKIGTSGRADYHDVWPDTAISNTWFNECSRSGEGTDDYPEPINPNLPGAVTIGENETYAWPQSAIVPQLDKSCIPFKDIIMEAWRESGSVAEAPYKWTRRNRLQGVLNDYLGPDSGNFPWLSDPVWDNFRRNAQVHNGQSSIGDGGRPIYYYLYCDKDRVPGKGDWVPPGPCRYDPKRRHGVAAVTFRSPGFVWSTYDTLLCPWWLGQQSGAPAWQSLAELAKEADGFETLRKTIDPWGTRVRALVLYHEVAHWQDVSHPTCDSQQEIDGKIILETYAPEVIVSRGRNGGSRGFQINIRTAHAWALSAVGMWMMLRWPDIGVPQPQRPIPGSAVLETTDIPDDTWVTELDVGYFDASNRDPSQFTSLAHYFPWSGGSGDCVEGTYEFEDQCTWMCNLGEEGRKCSKNSDDTWQCTGCDKEPTVCTPGLYTDFDACGSNCLNGLCSLNAGENGIRCTC